MLSCGVKKNFTKLQVMSTILPEHVINAVKPILRKQENEFPDKDGYKKLKNEVFRIFGSSQEVAFEKAMSRVLSGLPSQLARDIVNDMCVHDLDGCCCSKWVFGLWRRQLPSGVKQRIAGMEFNKETFDEVTKLADDAYMSTKPSVSVAALTSNPPSTLPKTQPPAGFSLPPTTSQLDTAMHQSWPSAEVAAASAFRGLGRLWTRWWQRRTWSGQRSR